MNEHPHDALPALALGALDANEASQVLKHVAHCPACRDDVAVWCEVVTLLPYVAARHEPPAHVKRRLFAMIDPAEQQPGQAARGRTMWAQRWPAVVAACSLALALVFGLLFVDARQRTLLLDAQLNQRDQTIQQLSSQVAQERKEMRFVLAAANQPLAATEPGSAKGTMYMIPGHNHAVLFFQGLKPPEGGKVYQFWLAKGDNQVPSATFTVGPDGTALVALDAPIPVDEYAQVMVTVEPQGGSQKPSEQVVLQANLAT